MKPLTICLILKTKSVELDDLKRIMTACQLQLRDVAEDWGRVAPVLFAAVDADTMNCDATLTLLDAPDDTNTEGHHEEKNGKPEAVVFVKPILDAGGRVLDWAGQDLPTVSAVVSHELCEMFINPQGNLWVDGPQGTYALEICDPVEGHYYMAVIGDGCVPVALSNYVRPGWFDPQASTDPTLSKVKNVHVKPFEITSGGYAIIRNKIGQEQFILGDRVPQWRLTHLRSKHSRWSRVIRKAMAPAPVEGWYDNGAPIYSRAP